MADDEWETPKEFFDELCDKYSIYPRLDPIFLTAHYWTKERYPAEEVTSDRFGRIRSQNMGYLLQLAMIYLKKENQ